MIQIVPIPIYLTVRHVDLNFGSETDWKSTFMPKWAAKCRLFASELIAADQNGGTYILKVIYNQFRGL